VEWNVGNRCTLGAEQVRVLLKIGAKAGGFPLMVDGPHEAAFSERFKAVVHGCKRNAWHAIFHPHKHLNGAGVVCLSHQSFENGLALFGLTDAFSERRRLREGAGGRLGEVGGGELWGHGANRIAHLLILSRTILIKGARPPPFAVVAKPGLRSSVPLDLSGFLISKLAPEAGARFSWHPFCCIFAISQTTQYGLRGIVAKIVLSGLIIALLPPVITAYIAVGKADKDREYSQGVNCQGAVEQVADKIDRLLFERYGDVQAFVFHPGAADKPAVASQTADTFTKMYGFYDLMIVADAEGKIIVVNTVDAEGKAIESSVLWGKSVKGEAWFEDCMSGKVKADESWTGDLAADPLVAQVYQSRGLSLNFSAPVLNAEGKPIRVWSNRVSWERAVRAVLSGLDGIFNAGI